MLSSYLVNKLETSNCINMCSGAIRVFPMVVLSQRATRQSIYIGGKKTFFYIFLPM